MIKKKVVSVVGGSGFIGKYLVDNLLSKGYYVKVISRYALSKKVFFPSARLGQYSLINSNITNFDSISNSVKDSDYIINLVGIIEQKSKNSFNEVHIKGAQNLANASKQGNVKKLIHISALGVDKNNTAQYAISKLAAEKKIKMFNESIIIRPSVVCGDEDNFLNFFGKFAKFSPFIPLIGGGLTQFQPIHVSDLVQIITLSLEKKFKRMQMLEVGGPDILSFKEILEYINLELNLRRKFINLPFFLAKKFAYITERLPISIITRDQVDMLKVNSTINAKLSFKRFLDYEALSFYLFAKKQLMALKRDGGHIN